jgi:hypothetical protein
MTVKWGAGLNALSLGETSIINPPYGALVPGDGFLSIQIAGRSAPAAPTDTTNLINVVVSVTPSGGSTTTYNPDQYGCVYLQEPLGTYGISLASPSGGPTFIDWQENLTPSQPSVSVSTEGLPAFVPTFHFDEAGTVTFSPSASAPAATNMPISVSNGGNLQPSGTAVVVVAGSNATSAALFPYATPYSVWYGDCTTVAGNTKEQPASPTTFALTPKGTTTAAITGLYTLAITATRAGGFTTAPNNAIATVNDPSAPGDGCPATAKGSAPLVPGAYQPYGLAGFAGATTTYSDQTALLPQTYTVKIPYNATSASFSMQVTAAGVVYNGTTYPFGTNVPVTLP